MRIDTCIKNAIPDIKKGYTVPYIKHNNDLGTTEYGYLKLGKDKSIKEKYIYKTVNSQVHINTALMDIDIGIDTLVYNNITYTRLWTASSNHYLIWKYDEDMLLMKLRQRVYK